MCALTLEGTYGLLPPSHTCMHACTCMYTHALNGIHAYTQLPHMYTWMHAPAHAPTHACMRTYTSTHARCRTCRQHTYAHTRTCAPCIHTCTYTYMHPHILTRADTHACTCIHIRTHAHVHGLTLARTHIPAYT
jgi:hypothetical protein